MNSEVEKMFSKTSISFITNEVLLDAMFELEVVTVTVKQSNLCTLYWGKKEAVEIKVDSLPSYVTVVNRSLRTPIFWVSLMLKHILERVPE